MGHRTVKRVPLDFAWPLRETWEGYVPPDVRSCPDCEDGATTDGRWLECLAHLILIAGDSGLSGRTHPWLNAVPLRPERPPTQRMAELSGGLAGRPPRPPFGHDAIDRWQATTALVKAAGLPDAWAMCPTCKGSGTHPEDAALEEGWKTTEPPAGDGWQLWETVSEGSPLSPVFASPEELAEWAAVHATVFGDETATAERWLHWIQDDLLELASMLTSEPGYVGSYGNRPGAS